MAMIPALHNRDELRMRAAAAWTHKAKTKQLLEDMDACMSGKFRAKDKTLQQAWKSANVADITWWLGRMWDYLVSDESPFKNGDEWDARWTRLRARIQGARYAFGATRRLQYSKEAEQATADMLRRLYHPLTGERKN